MNRKVLLGVVVVLTLVTAVVHGTFGVGMLTRAPGGGNRPPAQAGGSTQPGGTAPQGGQANGGGTAGGNGGGTGQGGANAQGGGGNRPAGGFRRPATPLAFLFPLLGPLFVANTIGYLLLLAIVALPIPYFKDHVALAHWLLIAFAAVTFVAYFGVNGFGGFLRNTFALIAKPDEILLIVFTYLHLRAVQVGLPAPAAQSASATAS